MRFAHVTTLEKPIDVVWRAFNNPANLKRWMPTLTNFEAISGTPGQPGAVSRMTFVENGGSIVMDETVLTRNEPYEFSFEYEAGYSTTRVDNRFESLAGAQTKWTTSSELKFKGLFWFLGLLMKWMIKKRVVDDCSRFKAKLESGALAF